MALSTSIDIKVRGTQTTSEDGRSDSLRRFVDLVTSLSDGSGAGQANLIYHDPSIVLGASASTSLDLSGSLEQPDGSAAVFGAVKLIAVRNDGAGSLTISRPGSNGAPIFDAASDAITVSSGGYFLAYNPSGWSVTASTADLLSIAADGSGATYAVLIIGTSGP